MLRLLLRLIPFPLAVLVLLVAIAPALGTPRVHEATWISGFRACALPCWATITPGRTPFDEAATRLRAVLPSFSQIGTSTSQINVSTAAASGGVTGFLLYIDGVVGYMRLFAALPAGEMVRQLGTPDCVWLEQSDTSGIVQVVYWETETLSVGAMFQVNDRVTWTPETRTTNLWMDTTGRACDGELALRWIGFAPLRRYAAQAGV